MALCGGIVLEEALDLSFDRLLMMMMIMMIEGTVFFVVRSKLNFFLSFKIPFDCGAA